VKASTLACVVSLAAAGYVFLAPSPWAALAIPIVWISAYCFGWYERDEKEHQSSTPEGSHHA
jgi:hypothetical protein